MCLSIGLAVVYSVPVQISMSVRWAMTVMGMLTAGILLAVMTASAGADMRETVSTAQVIHPRQTALVAPACIQTYKLRSLCMNTIVSCTDSKYISFTHFSFQTSMNVIWALMSV